MEGLSEHSLKSIEYGEENDGASKSDSNSSRLRSLSAFNTDASSVKLISRNFHLQFIPEKKTVTTRPMIPARKCEKLTFFRSYVSSSCKTEIISTLHLNFNDFVFYYVRNAFFKSLPTSYIYIFLGAYAPNHHLYLNKMIPFSYGCKFVFIALGLLDVIAFSDTSVLLFDYFLFGLFKRNPWNRCSKSVTHIRNITVKCYNFTEFINQFQNKKPELSVFGYKLNNEIFELSHVIYYQSRIRLMTGMRYFQSYFIVYFILMWMLAALNYKQIYKCYIWKILHKVHMFLNIILVIAFLHLTMAYLDKKFRYIPDISGLPTETDRILWTADLDLVAESMMAPPILQLITARSVEEVNIGSDSTQLVVSNTIYYIFKGFVMHKLKQYIDSYAGVYIQYTKFNQHGWFYFWPIYFSTFYFGDLYSIVFIFLNCCQELMTFIITFQCLVETVVCEWRFANRIITSVLMILTGVLIVTLTGFTNRVIGTILAKCALILLEIIVLYLLYPFRRLVDDITFHHGIAPSAIRVCNLRFAGVYYCFKFLAMSTMFMKVLYATSIRLYNDIYNMLCYVFIVIALTIIVGMIYIMFIFLYRHKKGWVDLFRPYPDWGPLDATTKRLRKKYDSREYIRSQAPRELSRHMIRKAESKVYRLDVRYDIYRRSTMPPSESYNIEGDTTILNETVNM